MSKDDLQVPKDHYYDDYDSEKRWMSYWHQIKNVLSLNPHSVLEIGPGNKTVSNYLKNRGLKVSTADVDPELEPDFVCDVRNITQKISEDSFDLVLCAEVLEHLPFEDFEKSLKQIYRITKRHVVMSLPHSAFNLKISAKLLPYIEEKRLLIKIPITRLMKHSFNGEHYWEIGKKNYPLGKIKEKITKFFEIKKTYCPYYQPSHRFFILENKT